MKQKCHQDVCIAIMKGIRGCHIEIVNPLELVDVVIILTH